MRTQIRYLVKKPGASAVGAGQAGLPRYFWQPAASLRKLGWTAQRVPADWKAYTGAGAERDAERLEAAAIAAAERLNAELDAARGQAEASRQVVAAARQLRTVDNLVALYRASDDYKRLAASTRRGYEQCLDRIGTWAGSAPVAALTPQRVQVLKKSLAATPAFANAILRVLRLLLEFGRREGWVTLNAAEKPRLLPTELSGMVWPREAVDLFTEAADAMGRSSIGTAVVLNEWIGQREGDVLRLPRGLFQRNGDGTITVRQSKTGAVVNLPVGMIPALAGRVDAELARLQASDRKRAERAAAEGVAPIQATTLIVSEETGQPYKADNFRHVFAAVRARMADRMREAAGFERDRSGAWLRPDGTRAKPAELRLAASFPVDYLPPGRDSSDPDAFLIAAEELTFMHLRHTAVTRLAEAECDDELISVITGHAPASVKAILVRYLVRTRKLARIAFGKRLAAEGGAPAGTVEEAGNG